MFVYILGFAIVFSLLILVISFYFRRITDVGLTDQFRAAESIANGQIPNRWILQINRRMAVYRLLVFLKRDTLGKDLALVKLDQLYRTFERSPFFESPEARQILLAQIQKTREDWVKLTWQEILTKFGKKDDSDAQTQ